MVNAVTDKVLVTNGLLATTDTAPTPDNWLASSDGAGTYNILNYTTTGSTSPIGADAVANTYQWLAVVAEPSRTGLGNFLPVPVTTTTSTSVNSTGTLDKIKFFQKNANSALGWQSSDTINIRDIQSYTYNAGAGHTPYAWVINFAPIATGGSGTPLAFGDRLRLRFMLENHQEYFMIPGEVEAVYQESSPSTTVASLSAYIDDFVRLINIAFQERWKVGYSPLIAYAGSTGYTGGAMTSNAIKVTPGSNGANCIIVTQSQVITDYSGRIDNLLSAFRMFPKSSYDESAQNEESSGWDQFGLHYNSEIGATAPASMSNLFIKGTLTLYIWNGADYDLATFPISGGLAVQATLGSGTARQVEDHLTKTDKGYRGFSNRIWMPTPITDQLTDGNIANVNLVGTNTATAVFDTHILEYYDHFRSVSGSVTNRNILKRLTIYNYRGVYTPGTSNSITGALADTATTGGGQILGSVNTSSYITNLMRILGV